MDARDPGAVVLQCRRCGAVFRVVLRSAVVLALLLAGRAPAAAGQDNALPAAAMGGGATMSAGSPRSQASASMLMPARSLTLGADVAFLTASGGGLGADELRFTDVVLFRPRGRYSFGKVELFAGTTLLPKQPSFTSELVWQGGHLGAMIALGERYAAFAQAGGGPMLDGAGWWTGFDAGVQARKALEEVIVFQGTLGGAATVLLPDQDTAESFWFAEIAGHGEILVQSKRGEFGAWLGLDYRLPLARNPADPDRLSGAYLDPQPRVNFHMGMVLAFLEGWDLYTELVILDRGDLEDPATTLPVLEGGFDQTHLVFGVLRRYRARTTTRALIAY